MVARDGVERFSALWNQQVADCTMDTKDTDDSKDISCVRFVCGFSCSTCAGTPPVQPSFPGLGEHRQQRPEELRIHLASRSTAIMLEVLPYKKSLACVWKSAW